MTSRSLSALARTHRPFCLGLIATVTLAGPPLATAALAAPTCSPAVGQRVILQSDAVDPDVFLWDSRARLVAYVGGGWDSTRDVMDHTLLATPGTSAFVVSCAAGAAHPKYAAQAVDAIGIKILRGAYRGRFGWVVSTDARLQPAASSRASR